MFFKLTIRENLTATRLKSLFLPNKAKLFCKNSTDSQIQNFWYDLIDFYANMSFKKNKEKLDSKDFAHLVANVSFYIENDSVFKDFCMSCFK